MSKRIIRRLLIGKKRFGLNYFNLTNATMRQKIGIIQQNRSVSPAGSKDALNIKVEINGQCNLDCVMCKRKQVPNRNQIMSLNQFEHILNELDHLSVWSPHGYNEPLLHPRFFDFVKLANERDIPMHLVTNATLIDRPTAQRLIETNPLSVRVSIDAVKEKYEQIRRGANWSSVAENIHYMSEVFRDTGIKFGLYATIWRNNIEQIPKLIDFAHTLDIPIRFVDITWMNEYGESGQDNAVRENEELLSLVSGFEHHRLEKVSFALGKPERRRCTLPWNTPYIDVIGDVYPCTDNLKDSQRMGNIFKVSMKDIWNGAQYRRFREQSLAGELDTCRNCLAWSDTL